LHIAFIKEKASGIGTNEHNRRRCCEQIIENHLPYR